MRLDSRWQRAESIIGGAGGGRTFTRAMETLGVSVRWPPCSSDISAMRPYSTYAGQEVVCSISRSLKVKGRPWVSTSLGWRERKGISCCPLIVHVGEGWRGRGIANDHDDDPRSRLMGI